MFENISWLRLKLNEESIIGRHAIFLRKLFLLLKTKCFYDNSICNIVLAIVSNFTRKCLVNGVRKPLDVVVTQIQMRPLSLFTLFCSVASNRK